jgi:hypothetical protein
MQTENGSFTNQATAAALTDCQMDITRHNFMRSF